MLQTRRRSTHRRLSVAVREIGRVLLAKPDRMIAWLMRRRRTLLTNPKFDLRPLTCYLLTLLWPSSVVIIVCARTNLSLCQARDRFGHVPFTMSPVSQICVSVSETCADSIFALTTEPYNAADCWTCMLCCSPTDCIFANFVMIRDHSFPWDAEFQAEPRNFPFAVEF